MSRRDERRDHRRASAEPVEDGGIVIGPSGGAVGVVDQFHRLVQVQANDAEEHRLLRRRELSEIGDACGGRNRLERGHDLGRRLYAGLTGATNGRPVGQARDTCG